MRLLLAPGLLVGVLLFALGALSVWSHDVWTNFDYERTWNGGLVPVESGVSLSRPKWGETAVLRKDDDGSYWYLRPHSDGGLNYRTTDGRDGFLHGGLVMSTDGHLRYFDNWSNAASRWQVVTTSFETDGRVEADCFGFTDTSVTARIADSISVYQFDLTTLSPDEAVECTIFPPAS